MKKSNIHLLAIPYYLWLIIFVITPLLVLFQRSFIGIDGQFTLANYQHFFSSMEYIRMTLSSFWYAFLVTFFTFLLAYPLAYFLSKSPHKDLWLMLIILPTWINLLLKTYAFIGIFGNSGPLNNFFEMIGLGRQQLLFTDTSFILVAAYIELPFMFLPIFNSINEIQPSLLEAAHDLGASKLTIVRRIIFPLSLRGVRSGVQAVFIPSLSLFMLTRLIGGNRVITLGTAVEQHFLVTQDWGMGSTIGVVLMLIMFIILFITRDRSKAGGVQDA
ncbi:ABC transporter permease [Facklamia miroungae]|uniref:Spermidine/putrescine transport system permease protein n=1 Tax=Facklamia miroungae TaxID=120956 RepID=A0A1G7RHW6_9LACT|nr:ABC transporter permease [Facklamia miroungae]NKZ29411.1 ABC transporter permease [Facklamia miroungae]SDG10225.1 spermidine/putrescine transport system permease protein [Facklamia miroungae]